MTTAKLNVFREWSRIVNKHEVAEQLELDALLRELVKYLITVGYDLDLKQSFIGKDWHGSDGWRMTGQLAVTERPENIAKGESPEQVQKWIDMATGLHGSARQVGTYSWIVDISDF